MGMRTFFSILIGGLALWLAASCEQDDHLQSTVSTVTSTYQIGGGDTVLKRQSCYDSAGSLIAEYVFGSRMDTVQKTLYRYDANGLQYKASYNGNTLMHESLVMSAGGRIMRIVERSGTDTLSITDNTYYPTGELRRTVVQFLYDSTSPLTVVTNYARNGKPETVYSQIYSDSTRIVISRMEMDKYTYTFDTAQHLIRSVGTITVGYHEAPDTLEDVRYQYDTLGRLLTTHYIHSADARTPDSIHYVYGEGLQPVMRIDHLHLQRKGEMLVLTDSIHLLHDAEGRLLEERSTLSGKHMLYRYSEK